ncbi:hypothetical protein A5662_26980 [Mycobacteriaceae bacterium 1482268.1]|nr:hypothetical protein A5662_26980 [Mycobacteriaceae bacterium 1482268.1]
MRIATSILAATAAAFVSFSTVVGAAPASAAPPKCSDLKGNLVGQNCVIQEADTGYNLNITYPASYPDVQAVFDWVKQTRDGFVNVAKSPDMRTQPYQLEVVPTEYNSAVPPRGTQSVVFKVYQNVGGAHPQTFFKAFNWDQTLRWPIVLDTGGREKTQPLFQPGANPWPVIFPLVQTELEKQMGTKPAIAPEVGLNPSTYENFAIQNDALVFFFGQGTILPEAAGALTVSIPRAPVDRMIA